MNELITANVKQVNVNKNEDGTSVYITIDTSIKRIKLNKETSTYVESDATDFSIDLAVLTAQLCGLNEYVGLYRASLGRPFTQADLGKIFFKAKISFTNEFVKEGTVYPGSDVVAKHDKYCVTIKKLEMNKLIEKMLEKACEFKFEEV